MDKIIVPINCLDEKYVRIFSVAMKLGTILKRKRLPCRATSPGIRYVNSKFCYRSLLFCYAYFYCIQQLVICAYPGDIHASGHIWCAELQ